ncbi:MAG: PQQ-binding-like beta-propeller repeat protein [Bacteroidota bacterium]
MRRKPLLNLAFIVAGLLVIGSVYWYYSHYRFTRKANQILEETGTEGGFIVHQGFNEGRFTAALRADDRYLVHGISPDKDKVEKARAYIHDFGSYGEVSVEQWDKEALPYTDNLVNLLVAEQPGKLSMDEVMRVLAPEGVAYIKQEGGWKKKVKPRPSEIDEWTHYLHGPDNNAVARDSAVGPPQHLQWEAGPEFLRSHEHMASISAVVSAGGRIFSIVDEGPTAFIAAPSNWKLVARDAFNGVRLWEKKIEPWEYRLRGFRSGPPELKRRLVASDDRVYVTLGYNKPVVSLNAATGAIEREYSDTKGTLEIVYKDGILYLVAGQRPSLEPKKYFADSINTFSADFFRGVLSGTPRAHNKRLIAVEASTGEMLWQKDNAVTEELMPTTLCLGNGRIYFQNPSQVVCLEAETGRRIWNASRPIQSTRLGWSTPTLVYHNGIVYSADRKVPGKKESNNDTVKWIPSSMGGGAATPRGKLIAFSAENGDRLWSCPAREGYNAPVDVLLTGGKLWTGDIVGANDPGITKGRDPKTGKVDVTRPEDQEFYTPGMPHHRCYRNKATSQYLITGRAGTEFVDMESGEAIPNHWVRGTCQYGVMPCNGLLYAPSHPCACFMRAKINGFNALAHTLQGPSHANAKQNKLEKGPAYNKIQVSEKDQESGNWPTYRHDSRRSGQTDTSLPENLSPSWKTKLKGELTSPVISGGRVFVASIDRHLLYALNANTGQVLWKFTAGGRIDSPPAIYKGRVLFGSADGKLYCLRASDGELVWRFQAGPIDRRIVSYGQLESAWPVHGSVLVENGSVYFSAGRSSFLDDGLHIYRLDPESGEILYEKTINSRDSETGQQPKNIIKGFSITTGALPDILSSQDGSIFLRHKRFNFELEEQAPEVPHLFSSTGFLDDSWWHRNYWIMGTHVNSGWSGWPKMGNQVPSGRLLAFNDSTIYGFGRDSYGRHGSHIGIDPATHWGYTEMHGTATQYRLFKARRAVDTNRWKSEWNRDISLLVRSMIMDDSKIFLAGPPNGSDLKNIFSALKGKEGGLLYIVSSEGQILKKYKLDAPPVFDGMAGAEEKIYLSTLDGDVLCFEDEY